MNNNNISPLGWVIIFCIVCAAISSLFNNNNTSVTTNTSSSSSSAERRYVEQRFKQEGYSSSDAATAADAVLKFQRAQEAQRSR